MGAKTLAREVLADPPSTFTGDGGVAHLELVSRRHYAVAVTMYGFLPEVRPVQLDAGCSGTLHIVLELEYGPSPSERIGTSDAP